MKIIYYSILVYLSTISTVTSGYNQSLVINIPQGPVRGYRGPEGHYFVFYGIPYATAPKGHDRFKAPLPPPSWDKTLEAVNKNVVCPQYPSPYFILNQQEDCLIANIYIPDTQDKNLPVLVHVHGGAFQFGYGDVETLKHLLIKEKIVIVNFNYRVNAHGLLCLGSKDVPGNAGMKDQVAFLRWIQKNIAYFGGNPNDVTLDGWSAGGASVDFLYISKMSRGLFHKGIIESGSSTGSFSVQIDPILNARNIAKELGFKDDNNFHSLEMFYKNASFELLTSIDVTNNTNSSLVFAPCIERDVGEEIFLDDYPINILKKGDVAKLPLLIGIGNMEGIFRVYNFEKWKKIMNKNFSEFLPEDLGFRNDKEKDMVAMMIKKFYFGNEPVTKDSILGYVDFFTDAMFGYGVVKTAELHAKAGNNQVYLYEYAYADHYQDYIPYTTVRGATHCAQTYALLDEPNENYFSENYKRIKNLIRYIWLHFIHDGKPFPKNSSYPTWPPVSDYRGPYMKLDTILELKDSLLSHRGLFWDLVYNQYYRAPVPPAPY